MLLDGVHVPLTTPFYPDGRLNVRKLEHNVRRYSLTPVNGLAALGSVSETESLNDAERREVLHTVGNEAAKEKVLLAGVGLPGVRESLSLAEHAAASGFDAVLVAAPAEFHQVLWRGGEPTTELLTYFRSVADGSPLPVVLVSDVSRAVLPLGLIASLSEHRNVLGLVEASSHISRVTELRALTAAYRRTVTVTIVFNAATRRMLRVQPAGEVLGGNFVSAESLGGGAALATASPVPAVPALKTRTREVGFQVVWGNAADATEALRAGANGLLMPISASVPQAAFEVWAAWKDGDTSLMHGKQARLAGAEKGMPGYDIAALKDGSELSGYFGGRPRLPLLPVTGERQAELVRLLNGMRS